MEALQEETTFQWWAEIWLPSIGSFLTLVLAGISLWIAARALKTSAEANHLTLQIHLAERREKRAAVVTSLSELIQDVGVSWIDPRPDALMSIQPRLLRAAIDWENAGNEAAASLVGQLQRWHTQVIQAHDTSDDDRRIEFLVEVSEQWRSARANYLSDDSEGWRMPDVGLVYKHS